MQTKEKIDLESKYSQKIQPLFDLNRKGYIEEKNVIEYKKFNFSNEDISELIELAMDDRSEEIDYELYEEESNRLYFATIYAVRVLGKLRAIEAIEPLLNKMYLNIESDFYQEAMISFLADIGVEAIEFIENDLLTVAEDKLTLFDGLRKIIEQNPSENERVEILLLNYLELTQDNGQHVAFAISLLVDISGAKHIEIIENIFKTKDVDVMIYGDFEDIEIKLGLKEKRSKPRKKNIFQKMVEKYELEDKIKPLISTQPKIGRNDPCPCGSGKKYKKCCLNK